MRILMQRMGALGDCLLTTPVLRRLRRDYPDAEIDVVTGQPNAYRGNPAMTSLCIGGAPMQGYDKKCLLDMAYERNRKVNQTDAFMSAAFGDTEGDKTLFLAHDKAPPNRLPSMPWNKVVVIHPNTAWPQRTLPTEWWQSVSDELVKRGYLIVVVGTRMDKPPCGRRILDLRERLSLDEVASVIEASAAALCGPSSIALLAGCTEAPVLPICNIVRSEWIMTYRHGELGWNTTPLTTPLYCYGCSENEPPSQYYPCRRGDNACLTSFDVTTVVEMTELAIQNDKR